MIKMLFFGTEEFAKSILEQLLDSQQFSVIGVVTKIDQIKGRNEIYKSPVKLLAEKNNLPIYQPESLKNVNTPLTPLEGGFVPPKSEVQLPKAEVYIVCQYGKIIPKAILDIPQLGTINIHTSLLPKYRGASPIQTALINGETETGVTIMQMDEKMDHGPILAQEKIGIDPDDTYSSLSKKMEPIAGKLLIQTINLWIKKEVQPQIQDESQATLCKLLERDDGKINWQKMSADQIYNLYRGTYPWPGVWTLWEGKRLKLTEIRKSNNSFTPGLVVEQEKKVYVGAVEGSIELLKIQMEGKKEMDIKSFVNGYKIVGAQLT